MANKICPECGTEQEDVAKFCKNCGASIPDKEEINISEVKEDDTSSEGSIACPECGAPQSPEARFCRNCGATLSGETKNDGSASRCAHCGCELHNEEFCPDCGNPTGIKICPQCRQKSINENYCPTCGYRLNANVKTCSSCGSQMDAKAQVCASCGARVSHKSPALSFILSLLFPGLGQLYNGQNTKAITLIIAYIVSWVLTLILIGAILALIIWVYGMYDAYTSAKAINNGETVEDKIF